MQTLTEIKHLLERGGLAPKHSLGQNFLLDHNLLRKLIESAGVQAGDTILEVGPGTGTLTEELLARDCRVIACELDDGLAKLLQERASAGEIPGGQHLTVIHSDCLESKEKISAPLAVALAGVEQFKMVANLPYGAATPLMLTLMIHHPACTTMAVTVQREVADRMLAEPSTPERGMLSVLAQAMCKVKRVASLPRECFWPRPDVASAMVSLIRIANPAITQDQRADFASFCKVLFSHRRKQLGGVLGRDFDWPQDFDPRARAEELTLTQIQELFHIWIKRTSQQRGSDAE
ncbi:MAG: ribosomal RNA small subunit methyltransferase A [Pyrinomonadaceae bacterium]|nr:ribosomal RNA small subunit methyltransferase A [Phycisphaerales bacterium]